MKTILILLAALALAGCVSSGGPRLPAPIPVEFEQVKPTPIP